MQILQYLLEQLASYESLKQDRQFRAMLNVNQTLEEPTFFSQAGKMV
jgi:hypothetical protein